MDQYQEKIPISQVEHHVQKHSPTFDGVEDPSELPAGYFTSSLFLGSITAIGMGLMSAIAGFGYIAPILGVINDDIGPSPNLFWVALVYTLMIAIGLTVVGRCTDIFGRRYTFIGGAVLGVIGSIVSARAQNINTLVAGMTFIGLAASTQVSYFYVTAELIPMKYRFVGNAVMYIFAIPGGAFSPAIANSVILHTAPGWRTCFYILLAYNTVTLLCWIIFYRPPTFNMKHQNASKREFAKRFDYLGTILFMGGLLIFLMGLSWGGSAYAWDSAHVLTTIIVGGLALVAFIFWELFAKLEEPLVPLRLLRAGPWTAAVVTSGLGASLYYCLAIVWPSMVAIVYPSGDLIKDGLTASIVGAGWVVGEILSGFVAKPVGWIKTQCTVALTLAGIFLGCMATCNPSSKDRACILMSLSVFFAGYVEGLALTITTLALDDQQQIGSACGFGGSIRFTIATIASTIYTVVLTNRLTETISHQVPTALTNAGLPESSVSEFITALLTGGKIDAVPGVTANIAKIGLAAYKTANADAYGTVFLTTIAFTGVGIIATFFLPNVDLLLTNEVATRLHKRKEKHQVQVSGQDVGHLNAV